MIGHVRVVNRARMTGSRTEAFDERLAKRHMVAAQPIQNGLSRAARVMGRDMAFSFNPRSGNYKP